MGARPAAGAVKWRTVALEALVVLVERVFRHVVRLHVAARHGALRCNVAYCAVQRVVLRCNVV